ncbi:MAG: HlyC/CorC family transporter, partial [Deltaproteobacteria bacterium]|nr:HlyC/CorC family transporter [Deltaproteobacteria bacterium]
MSLELEAASLVALILCSAFFSGVETAFVSLSAIRLQHLVESGKKGIAKVARLKKDPQRLIITILIGNNLVNIAASSLATSVAIEILGSVGVGIAVGVMTFLILVFGEITPKTIAMMKAEWICIHTAPILYVLQFLFWPAIVLLQSQTKALSKPLGRGANAPLITEEEIKSVVSLGEEIGEVEEDERIMIHNIFRFSDLECAEIMTDRTQIFSVEATRTVEEVTPEIVRRGYSRIPVYDVNPDRMVGVLYAKDVLQALISNKARSTVRELARSAMFVPETMLVDDLLREFQKKKIHIALVVDEHGGVSGLVTIEDLLEEIVGEIYDETDRETIRIQKLGKNKALVKGD